MMSNYISSGNSWLDIIRDYLWSNIINNLDLENIGHQTDKNHIFINL